MKCIHTSFYGRIKLYTCDHSTFTVWCNYDALDSFAVVTIIFCMFLFNLYLNLLIYLCTWSYLLLLLLVSLLFLTLILIRLIDWYELELVSCILFIWFFISTILSTRNKIFQSNPIQKANELWAASLSHCKPNIYSTAVIGKFRSSRPEVWRKNSSSEDLRKFSEKQPWCSPILIKFWNEGLQPY